VGKCVLEPSDETTLMVMIVVMTMRGMGSISMIVPVVAAGGLMR
jgi:hypothetical protein